MKVVCILKNKHLTINKIYDAVYIGMFTYDIINDNNEKLTYVKRNFIELNKTRIHKLNKSK